MLGVDILIPRRAFSKQHFIVLHVYTRSSTEQLRSKVIKVTYMACHGRVLELVEGNVEDIVSFMKLFYSR